MPSTYCSVYLYYSINTKLWLSTWTSELAPEGPSLLKVLKTVVVFAQFRCQPWAYKTKADIIITDKTRAPLVPRVVTRLAAPRANLDFGAHLMTISPSRRVNFIALPNASNKFIRRQKRPRRFLCASLMTIIVS